MAEQKPKISEEKLAEYKEAFQIFDKNGDGTITVAELSEVLSGLGQKRSLEEVKKMIAAADTNNNETVELSEFIVMMEKSGIASDEDLKRAFKIFDKDDDGKITHSELKQAMNEMGQDLSDKEIADMIKAADLDNDQEINFEEFKKMMSS